LDYDNKTINFVKLSVFSKHVFALTDKGELYGWGSNNGFRLGLDQSIQSVNKPVLIDFFNKPNFKVLEFSCGEDHSLVHVQETDEFGYVSDCTY
jgi:alpha-tubulin suppressor-like RCC1 family protein